ncbi:MAG: hypothetical protein AAGI03_16340 [Pseudomonadota bacterium]
MSTNSMLVYIVALCVAGLWIYLSTITQPDPIGELTRPTSTLSEYAQD